MLDVLNHSRIPVISEVEVFVVGAGSAGCCAALAAREGGAGRVALLERYGFLGGTSTFALDTFYGFYTPGAEPRKVVGGLPDRVVDALHDADAMYLRPNTYGSGTGVTYEPEYLKLVWDDLLQRARVEVLHFAMLVDVESNQAGDLTAAVIATKSGFFRIKAKRFIDASGDADLCHLAGFPYEKAGESAPAQMLTTTFRICNVDIERFEKAGGKQMLAELMASAVESGEFALPRRQGSAHPMVQIGCVSTIAVRVGGIDVSDFRQLGEAEREGRRQSFLYEAFFRACVPGYENARMIGLSTQIGIRESRRVYGEYRLTRDDCLTIRRFDNRVFLCGAPIEDHRQNATGEEETVWVYIPDGKAYDVPYRTLVPAGRDDVWMVGRCFSATHDAHASCRSMAQTMCMGQATGTPAALSLQHNCGARSVPIGVLQDKLRSAGAVLETPAEPSPTNADAWGKQR